MPDTDVTTLSQLFLYSCQAYKKPDRMMVKRDGVWTKISTDEVEARSGACPSASGPSA